MRINPRDFLIGICIFFVAILNLALFWDDPSVEVYRKSFKTLFVGSELDICVFMDVNRSVKLCPDSPSIVYSSSNGRFGNQISSLATSLAFREKYGLRPVLLKFQKDMLEEYFENVDVPVFIDEFDKNVPETLDIHVKGKEDNTFNEYLKILLKKMPNFLKFELSFVSEGIMSGEKDESYNYDNILKNPENYTKGKSLNTGIYPNAFFLYKDYLKEIKDEFKIKKAYIENAREILTNIGKRYSTKVIYVGVHFRRTDYQNRLKELNANYHQVEGHVLCSGPWSTITSVEECKEAAQELSLEWGATWDGKEDFPGCVFASDWRKQVFFNTSPNSSSQHTNDNYAALCKQSTKGANILEYTDERFFEKGVQEFRSKFSGEGEVVFVVVSDDMPWALENLQSKPGVFIGSYRAKATSSSQHHTSTNPVNVLDGIVDTTTWSPQFVSQAEDFPWLQIDLERQVLIDKVVLYPRGDCCQDRFGNFQVRLGNGSLSEELKNTTRLSTTGYQCGEVAKDFPQTQPLHMSCKIQQKARYIFIQGTKTSMTLELSEVFWQGPGDMLKAPNAGVSNGAVRDFALLSLCNHSLLTYGTFGQWAAIYAGGHTILPIGYAGDKVVREISEIQRANMENWTFVSVN